MRLGIGCDRLRRSAVLSIMLLLLPLSLSAQNVLTWHNDVSRTGQQLNETTLTLSNVNQTQFGLKFKLSVDAPIFAQPLYVGNVAVSGQGTHNVVYVATENDSVYAFDAGGNPTTPLWHDTLTEGGTAVPCGDTVDKVCEISPNIGITGAPVIDTTTNTLYVVAFTVNGGVYFQYLHALDITSGAEKFGGPVEIQASVPGIGSGSQNGVVTFTPLIENQRSALLESDGVIYITWASFGDDGNYNGWIMGYNATTLAQESVFNDDPNGEKGGIWMSGGGLSADSDGNLYAVTGNGTFDVNTGGVDYGDSALKLASGLSVLDYFTPDNQLTDEDDDLDLGSTGALILPTQTGKYPDELTFGDKGGTIFLIDRDDMGEYHPSSNDVIQTITGAKAGYFGTPAYFNNAVFYSGQGDNLDRYTLSAGKLSKTPASKSPTTLTAGGTPSISANGTENGIVWVVDAKATSGSTAELHAYKASNVSDELYNTQQDASRDTLGTGIRFSTPTIANGNVYVGSKTSSTYSLYVYGLLSAK